jgi:hypothetical protein
MCKTTAGTRDYNRREYNTQARLTLLIQSLLGRYGREALMCRGTGLSTTPEVKTCAV